MTEILQKRLEQLQAEYEGGQNMLANLESQHSQLTNTMLRISGAMQVLRELIANEQPPPAAQS